MIHKSIHLVDRLHWLWLGLAAPFVLFPSAKRSLVLLIIPITWILHWALVRSDERSTKLNSGSVVREPQSWFPVTPLNLAMLLLAVMVLISLWTTYDLSISLGKIAGIVLGFGIYYTVTRLSASKRGFWVSLGAFLSIGLGIAVLGLFGTNWFTTKITILNPISSRLPALIIGMQGAQSGFQPNEVAGTLIWILPLVLSLFALIIVRLQDIAITFRKTPKIIICLILMIISLVMTVVLVLTQSRGAYIGFSITILLLILVTLPKKWKWGFISGLGFVIILSGVLLSAHWREVQDWFSGDNLLENSTFSINSLEGRLTIWSNAIKGIQDFPFTGMGLNTFRTLNNLLYPNSEIPPEFDLGHAHNEFLQVGVELGTPGMIAFISLYIGAAWMLIKTWKRTFLLKQSPELENPEYNGKQGLGILAYGPLTRSILLGLGGGLLAHFLYGLTDAVALGAKPGFVFWALLGLITGLFSLIYKPNHLVDQVYDLSLKDS